MKTYLTYVLSSFHRKILILHLLKQSRVFVSLAKNK